jgi:Tfp pilus assembly protein PilF
LQLGNVLEGIGDFTKATLAFETALKLLRPLADEPATARVLNSLGLVSLNSGHAEKAVQYHRESLELRRKTAQPRAMFIAQLNLGDAQKYLGQLTEARKLFSACLQIAQSIGDHFGETLVSSQLADIDRREHHLKNAMHGFESTLKRCQNMGHGYVEVIALRGIGLTLQDLGQLEPAKTRLLQSLKVSMQLEAAPQTNLTLVALAELEQQNGNLTSAWQITQLVLQRQPAPREQQLLEKLQAALRKKMGTKTQESLISLEEILPFEMR